MVTETETYSGPGTTTLVPVEEPARAQVWGHYISRAARFVAILIQFALVVIVVDSWQLENQQLARLMWLAFVGFIIHHLLPLRFRLPFFALLSMVAVITGVGHLGPNVFTGWVGGRMTTPNFLYHFLPGVTLVAIGLGLIGLCHLPMHYWLRVSLIALAGAALAILRANSRLFPDVAEMWVILGSLFMFRLMLYLYDLKHRTASFSPARAISYFFMLPNVCFPLFPVVDYKTFCSTYYNEDWPAIYQNGLRWMFRGVVQLLLYRIIYQFAPLDVYKLSSALDAAGCVLGMYLLYLRISGTFHLIVGLLHMFGFNLPETHHLYLLASSFTDFWRRINIYWKDFVMKLFFYPTHFALRRIGAIRAMSIATVVTFLATWLLHSSSRETSEGRGTQASRPPFQFWRSAGTVAIGALCLLAAPSIATRTIPGFKNVVARLHGDVLNSRDLALQRRGYYEELDVGRMDNWQSHIAEDPEGWRAGDKVFFHTRSDFLLRDIVPMASTTLGGVPITSNHLGMRDREYESIKPANTYRIALLGASNDTVAADSILQRVLRLEQVGLEFQPDAAILSITAVDEQFIASHLRKALIQGVEPSPGYRDMVESIIRKARVNGKMPAVMIERRLQPYFTELCMWSFQRFAQQCAQRGVRPIVMYRPAPADFSGLESAARSKMLEMARNAGLEVIDLSPAFDSVTDRSSLMLAKWDDHTTALGHRLLANELYEHLVPLLFGSPSKQQVSRLQKP